MIVPVHLVGSIHEWGLFPRKRTQAFPKKNTPEKSQTFRGQVFKVLGFFYSISTVTVLSSGIRSINLL